MENLIDNGNKNSLRRKAAEKVSEKKAQAFYSPPASSQPSVWESNCHCQCHSFSCLLAIEIKDYGIMPIIQFTFYYWNIVDKAYKTI